METLQTRLDAAAERGYYDRMEQLNFAFHRTIYRLARAPKISWLLGAAALCPARILRRGAGLAGGLGL